MRALLNMILGTIGSGRVMKKENRGSRELGDRHNQEQLLIRDQIKVLEHHIKQSPQVLLQTPPQGANVKAEKYELYTQPIKLIQWNSRG